MALVETSSVPLSRWLRLWRWLSSPLFLNESLDQTGGMYRRRDEAPDPGTFRASGSGVNFPTAILLYLVAQLIGGIWWAATMQARQDYLTAENVKLWQKVETHDLQLAKMDSLIRAAVKEAMQDADYIRLKEKER